MPDHPEETTTDVVPVALTRIDGGIRIEWSNGAHCVYRAAGLRAACPCATCREKHGGTKSDSAAPKKPFVLPVLSRAEAQPITIEGMRAVGNYAYNIAFSDGHDTGIFTFDQLLSLGEQT